MDSESHAYLTKLAIPEIIPISLPEFEQDDNQLLEAKQNRSVIEYYFTCTPSLPLFVFRRYQEVDLLTYLDADLFFFADPEALFDEIGMASIAIIPHRFPPNLSGFSEWGVYNVGWLSFRRDANAEECLLWWREQCIEWCYDRVEPTRCADQKYLDRWPEQFKGVRVLEHKGANLAPWNISRYHIRCNGKQVFVDEQELLFFHFHGLKRISTNLYDTGVHKYRTSLVSATARHIYAPYIRALEKILPGMVATTGVRYESFEPQSLPLWRKLARKAIGLTRRIPEFFSKKLIFVSARSVWY